MILNIRKFKKTLFIIKKIPILRTIVRFLGLRIAFPLVQFEGVLSGFKGYVYDLNYSKNEGFQEPHIVNFFINNLKNNKVFFDVGAHFGYYTLFARKIMGDDCKIISFEPSPIPFKFLRKNIEINKLQNNIKAEQLLISEKKSKCNLYYSGFGGTKSSFKKSTGLFYKKELEAISLDDYCSQVKLYPDFVKIDVEGAELLVTKGARSLFVNNTPNMLIELHYSQLRADEIKEIISILLHAGYKIYSLFPNNNLCSLRPFSFDDAPNHIYATVKKYD